MGTVVVPTAETVRLTYLMERLVKVNAPVMFVGSAGTGKTVLVSDFLSSLSVTDEAYKFSSINMNFYTDSFALQQQLEQSIDKRSGKTYGPPGGSKLVYFIDDLNLPFVETYGTQTPIALMRQHIDHGSWFDRSDMSLKKQIVDSQYICCMNQKSGSFFVDPRLQVSVCVCIYIGVRVVYVKPLFTIGYSSRWLGMCDRTSGGSLQSIGFISSSIPL